MRVVNDYPCCWVCTPDYWGMLLCPTCGNKRCPRASCHEFECTNSNEPGQFGSVYGPFSPLPSEESDDDAKSEA